MVPQAPPVSSTAPPTAPKARLLRGKELWILGTMLALALLLPCIALSRAEGLWQTVAWAALTAGVAHAAVFAWLWWRYRVARMRALADARLMLGSKIKTQLTLIMAAAAQSDSNTRQRSVQNAAEEITRALQNLDEDALREWHWHHDEALKAAKQGGLKLP